MKIAVLRWIEGQAESLRAEAYEIRVTAWRERLDPRCFAAMHAEMTAKTLDALSVALRDVAVWIRG